MKSLLTYINEAGGSQFAGLVRKFLSNRFIDQYTISGDLIVPAVSAGKSVLDLTRTFSSLKLGDLRQSMSADGMIDNQSININGTRPPLAAVKYRGIPYLVVRCKDMSYYRKDDIHFFEEDGHKYGKCIFFLFNLKNQSTKKAVSYFRLFNVTFNYKDEKGYDTFYCEPDLCIANYFTNFVTDYGGPTELDIQKQAYMDLVYASTELFNINFDKLKEKMGVEDKNVWNDKYDELWKLLLKRSTIERELDDWTEELTGYIKILAKNKVGVKSVRMKKFIEYIDELKDLLPKYRDDLNKFKRGEMSSMELINYSSEIRVRHWFNGFEGALETIAGMNNKELLINDTLNINGRPNRIMVLKQLTEKPFLFSGKIKGVDLPNFRMKTKCPKLLDLYDYIQIQ